MKKRIFFLLVVFVMLFAGCDCNDSDDDTDSNDDQSHDDDDDDDADDDVNPDDDDDDNDTTQLPITGLLLGSMEGSTSGEGILVVFDGEQWRRLDYPAGDSYGEKWGFNTAVRLPDESFLLFISLGDFWTGSTSVARTDDFVSVGSPVSWFSRRIHDWFVMPRDDGQGLLIANTQTDFGSEWSQWFVYDHETLLYTTFLWYPVAAAWQDQDHYWAITTRGSEDWGLYLGTSVWLADENGWHGLDIPETVRELTPIMACSEGDDAFWLLLTNDYFYSSAPLVAFWRYRQGQWTEEALSFPDLNYSRRLHCLPDGSAYVLAGPPDSYDRDRLLYFDNDSWTVVPGSQAEGKTWSHFSIAPDGGIWLAPSTPFSEDPNLYYLRDGELTAYPIVQDSPSSGWVNDILLW